MNGKGSGSVADAIRGMCERHPYASNAEIVSMLHNIGVNTSSVYVNMVCGKNGADKPKRGRPRKIRCQPMQANVGNGSMTMVMTMMQVEPVKAIRGTMELAAKVGGMAKLSEIVNELVEVG